MDNFDEKVAAAKVVCDALEAVESEVISVKIERTSRVSDTFDDSGTFEDVFVMGKSVLGGDWVRWRWDARERIADALAARLRFVKRRSNGALYVSGRIDGVAVTVAIGVAPFVEAAA